MTKKDLQDAISASPPLDHHLIKFALFSGDGKITPQMYQEVLSFRETLKQSTAKE